MEATEETVTEKDKVYIVSRLQMELGHTGIQQYNCEAYFVSIY
jgi:hypothetical protein